LRRTICGLILSGLLCFAAEQYEERYRPQFHFSPQINWTNDPCGLIFAFGKYHLFFQYNPFGNTSSHKSWGHATSTDLVHWTELPVAIREDEKAAIFTGSSVVDDKNTSGLCEAVRHGCIVSIYTGFTPKSATTPEKQMQNLAYSQDGVTWTKYPGNPVLDLGRGDTRDPKVFWYEPQKKWVMVIVQANDKKVRLFSSPNLKEWTALSDFGPWGATGGVWECPDLYTLPRDGQTGKMRWILKIGLGRGGIAGGSGEQYFIGNFDGKTFTPDEAKGVIHWLDYGPDCYCALTFNHEPAAKGPRMISWMNNWQYAAQVPTTPWRGAMTVPRELRLAKVNESLGLLQQPVEELRSLRRQEFRYQGASESDLNSRLKAWPYRSQLFELEVSIQPGQASQVAWRILGGAGEETVVGYDAVKRELFVDRTKSGETEFSKDFPSRSVAPLALGRDPLRLHLLVDRSSVEVFAQNGAVAMTNLVFPKPASTGLSIATEGGRIQAMDVRVWALGSIWRH